ncbi:MAG TPA: hypothetical protein VJV23_09030 [Candidatus Polarisedimenticolia bacterium]|nr:hypothetical protein [Candidatus Polarisedimenticolia bacterium]
MSHDACAVCSAAGPRIVLGKCPICFKAVCEGCRVSRGGRHFCSQYCADYFFFGDEE